MYNIYELNIAYNSFVKRFGIEPNGVLINHYTKVALIDAGLITITNAKLVFIHGIPVFTSVEMEDGKIRFVI